MMLRLTRVTDYGILLLTHMASLDGKRVTTNDLAVATHVPAPTVSKVLQMLLGAGLLESIRGAQGGYQLSRSTTDISVREIIHCLEGNIALMECNLDDSDCEQMPYCSTHNNWKRINQAIRDVLANITLADMTSPDFSPMFSIQKTIPLRSAKGLLDGK
ncbi:MAG: SUF system Fe-S cluster assembly regulator [Mariprofundaceae bacterium]